MTTRKRQLTAEEAAECAALKAIYAEKKKALKLTQDELGDRLGGIGQSAVSHYLNGVNALNIEVASGFARELQISVSAFSPRLAAEIARIAQAAPGAPSAPASPRQGEEEPIGRAIVGRALFEKITPRSRALVDRILEMEAHGALTDEDLKVLTEIVERFGSPK